MCGDSALNISMDDPTDAVEALWARSGKVPDLTSLLANRPHWSPSKLRAALLVDQQFRSRTPQPWSTEVYSALVSFLVADDDFTLDLIVGEFRGRSHQGRPPSLQELSGRFPHLQRRLELQLEIASWFEDASNSDFVPDDEDSVSETPAEAIRFGDYDVYEEISRGGMGVIYRARHRKLKRIVALKMIRPEWLMRTGDLRRFRNETQIIAQLEHPNIIHILNVDQVDGIHFFTMRMIEGRNLDQRRLEYLDDLKLAARLVSAVSAAIHYAHQHGVLHRDLKPSNVLVDEAGVPFVVDFGLAGYISEMSDMTMLDEFVGTPAYVAPELVKADALPPSAAADVYGLGAILYVLLTGQPPYTGKNTFEVWEKIRYSEPRPPRELNTRIAPDLAAICLKALEKNPADRYFSAAELAEDLNRYLSGEPVVARPVSWRQRHGRPRRNHPVGPALVFTIFVLLSVIVVQSISLHKQAKQTDAAQQEMKSYRRALETAEEQAKRLKPDAAANPPRSRASAESR